MTHSKRFTYNNGDSFIRSVDILDDNGNEYDLTGSTVWYVVKEEEEDEDDDAVLWLYWNDDGSLGITVGTPETGIVSVFRSASDMAALALAPGPYYWYLRLRDVANIVYTVDSGILDVLAGPTALTPPV